MGDLIRRKAVLAAIDPLLTSLLDMTVTKSDVSIITASVRALPSVGVTVKPLEWDGFVAGNYRIDVKQGGIANLWFYSASMVENEEPELLRGGYLTLVSIDELKETAQAHHNACTMAALDVQPAPAPSPDVAALVAEIAKLESLCDCDCDNDDCLRCAHYPTILEQKRAALARKGGA